LGQLDRPDKCHLAAQTAAEKFFISQTILMGIELSFSNTHVKKTAGCWKA
jgi:hypothetical protein